MAKTTEELGSELTDKQKALVDLVYLCGVEDKFQALEEAGYNLTSITNKHHTYTRVMNNAKVKKYIESLRLDKMNDLMVDEYFIIDGIKKLAQSGSNDNVKLQAFRNLAQIRGMLVEKQEVVTTNDPGKIAKGKFAERLKQDKNKDEKSKNTIPFPTDSASAGE